ncbi:MAG: hypothetical protein K9K66_10805 [Desulfarculaceae bacterium]|nr:hypothetical protein [Desulfarculaceae bacterium]MCF8102137.1 hypothetical protein [Desulfarculaceae bacterium]MCF8118318.1 hypothetical protein [Desulfarculaceae bacterium]
MWNEPSQVRLDAIPRIYETEGVALNDKMIHLHFFLGGCDWYVAEFDGEDIFFGYVILNQDHQNAEWGYFSFKELKAIRIDGFIEVDCETEEHWQVRKASQVRGIKWF